MAEKIEIIKVNLQYNRKNGFPIQWENFQKKCEDVEIKESEVITRKKRYPAKFNNAFGFCGNESNA